MWYVTSSATGGVTCQSRSNNFVVTAQAVSAGPGGVSLTLRNGTGQTVTMVSATGRGDFNGAGVLSTNTVAPNQTVNITGINAPPNAATNLSNTFDDGRVEIVASIDTLPANFDVICTGKV
ncbi:MAG: hypothetical protein QXK06_00805 [Candidatus Diapherotrites archaeon]